MPDAVREAIDERPGAPLFVACSGGADSLFALLGVWSRREAALSGARPVHVLHLDHALRGEESEDDARFVQSVCRSLEIPMRSERARWNKPLEQVNEDDARVARLRFFHRACADVSEPVFDIVTGHHADDVVESMLLRLSRGSGLQGLTAPRPVSMASDRIRFLRTMIEWDRKRVQAVLTAVGAIWREDSSNVSGDYHRNRLRQQVVPAWEAAADRPLAPGVCRSRRLLEEDWRALEAFAEQAERTLVENGRFCRGKEIDLEPFRVYPAAIQRRLLRRYTLAAAGAPISASVEEAMLTAIRRKESASFDLSPRFRVEVEPGRIRLVERSRNVTPSPFFASLPAGARVYLPDGAVVACETVPVTAALRERLAREPGDDGRRVYVACGGKQSESLFVRQRRAGDAFNPNGKSSQKKLKDLLIERKISVGERDRLPVITDSTGAIVWVPGLPPAVDRLIGVAERLALRLTYEKGPSTFSSF